MNRIKILFPLVFLFLLLNVLFLLFPSVIIAYGFNINVLEWGNVFLFVLSVISLLLQQKGIRSGPHVFIRYFYISFIVKFLLVAVVTLAYTSVVKKINKPSVLVCMGEYLVYTFIETGIVLKSSRKKNA